MDIFQNLQHEIPPVLQQWTVDCVVIGSGIAGLFTALEISKEQQVLLITKKSMKESNTNRAQGGIAAVFSDVDSPQQHKQDTLLAGAGLCDTEQVDILVRESPEAVRKLISYGVIFDRMGTDYALTQEGAHSQRRILHANGDATGAEIVRGLTKKIEQNKNIHVLEHTFTTDLLLHQQRCTGVLVQTPDQHFHSIKANAVVLATGGAGQLYKYTTNPSVATGDGVAMAFRAGAEVQDLEFIQFHPTVLCHPGAPRFLISEAVRGEGAILRNTQGQAFMSQYHPLKELAPRDVVARAILDQMERHNLPCVYIDMTHEEEQKIKERFPTIFQTCLQYGLNMAADWIPVAPAAHYMMGGVKTDHIGRTSIDQLYACGEAACTGVHGANRLASNSLSEAVVFGVRIARHIIQSRNNTANQSLTRTDQMALNTGTENARNDVQELVCTFDSNREWPEHVEYNNQHGKVEQQNQWSIWRVRLQKAMLMYVGLKRDHPSLQKIKALIEPLYKQAYQKIREPKQRTMDAYEVLNLLLCARLVVHSAERRKESRGGHYRSDFTARNDQEWKNHLIYSYEQQDKRIKERTVK